MMAVHYSHLKNIAKSPAHFKASQRDYKPSAVQQLGRAIHAMVFDQPYVLFPGKVRRGKVWDAFKEEHSGSLIINQKEHDEAEAIAYSILHSPAHAKLLGTQEETLRWEMEGIQCEGTPDVFSDVLLTDLKSTVDASPDRFTRDCFRYTYHAQIAWYRNALEILGYPVPNDCYIVGVEKTAPYPVTIFRLTDATLEAGERTWRAWWETFKNCQESKCWPGYSEAILDLDVPADEGELELVGFEEVA